MGVLHREANVAVAGEFSRLRKRCSASQKFGHVRMPAGGVEVGDAFGRHVFDVGSLQVLFDHQPRLFSVQSWKERLIVRVSLEPLL